MDKLDELIYDTKKLMMVRYPRFASEIAAAKISYRSDLGCPTAATDGKKGSGVLHSVFLPLKSMKGKYRYLENKPDLLPDAWIQRICGYLKETKNAPSNDLLDSVRIGNDRVKLLEHYHIIQKK